MLELKVDLEYLELDDRFVGWISEGDIGKGLFEEEQIKDGWTFDQEHLESSYIHTPTSGKSP